jgi:hypothetical protein
VTASGGVQFNPAVNRVFIRFKDGSGLTRGSTSVAAQAVAPLPNIGGTYSGSGSFSQANCQDPSNDVTLGVLVSARITGQSNATFVGGVTATYPWFPGLVTQLNITGSVNLSGQASGTLTFSTFANGSVVTSGSGTFAGQLSGNSLTNQSLIKSTHLR